MVIVLSAQRSQGALIAEMVIAIAIFLMASIPLTVGFLSEMKLVRAAYCEAVAMEIVDGEIEILKAGEWRAFQVGQHIYEPVAGAVTNLPPGKFTLTVSNAQLRLEWAPEKRRASRAVVREVKVQ